MVSTTHRRRRMAVAGTAVAVSLLAAGCSKSDDSASGADNAASGGGPAATVASSAPATGDGCTLSKYGATKIDLKNAIVGFSQSEPETAAFRVAETKSIQDEAAKLGVKKLLHTNANAQLSKQIADIQDMLNQGAQFLIVAPLNSDGLEPALAAAKAKRVPVLTIDRKVNATACSDYVAFIGSNFVEQGKRAADALAKSTGGKGNIAILLGSSGNNVTTDRTSGFLTQIKKVAPDMKVVAQQTGDFARDKGQSVMETLLQAHPEITAVYAENDEMGLGAVVAISAAGKKPGVDIKVVSIDGIRSAVQAIVDGKYNAVIESNPRFGPLAFKTAQDFLNGVAIPADVIISDNEYDKDNAKDNLGNAF
ncbi:ABC transporter substrate-binding protein [Jatrophihabitans sp.]|uniref:ABC transporter substrate-binding protein n=1 Tax=Jatrophihabitans sp. TaxID=1932789 RepID=UPI0038CD2FDD